MSKNIISFALKKREYDLQGCQHKKIIIDESKALIECKDCGIQINPIWYLCFLAREENQIEYRLNHLKGQWRDLRAKIKTRTRTKCQHCGNMTQIGGIDHE